MNKKGFIGSAFALSFWLLPSAFSAQTYCTPSYTVGCADGYDINDFVLAGENGTSISDLATGCSAESYDDKTSLSPVEFHQGGTYTMKISTNFPPDLSASPLMEQGMNAVVWIDFNDNGTFDNNEKMVVFSDYLQTSLTDVQLTIPADAAIGTHRLRVVAGLSNIMMGTPNPGVDAITACVGSGNIGGIPIGGSIDMGGETHDYRIAIIDPSSTPNCDNFTLNLGADTTICADATVVLNANIADATTYSWSSGATSPIIMVTQAGTYSVTVSNADCQVSDEIVIAVTNLPTVTGILVTNSGTNSYTFEAENASDVVDYAWDFGDGTMDNGGATVTHTYSDNATYTVALIYSNDCGSDMKSTTVGGTNTNNTNELMNASVTIYPNPSNGFFTIQNHSDYSINRIKIYNVMGQLELSTVFDENHPTISTSLFTKGIYWIEMETQMGTINKKIVIE